MAGNALQSSELYELWLSSAEGMQRGPCFADMKDALREAFAAQEKKQVAIRMPGGDWYHFSPGVCVLPPKRPSPEFLATKAKELWTWK